MRRVRLLTKRGTGALVLALGCFAVANQLGLVELIWFGLLMLALVIGSVLAVVAGRGRADVTRTVSPSVPEAGTDLSVSVHVVMRSTLPAMGGRWHDDLPRAVTGTAYGTFPAVASGFSRADRTAELTYRAVPRQRGVHWLGPLEVTSTDPFGIARRTVSLGELTRLVVTPATVELPTLSGMSGRSGGTVPSPANRLGQGTDDIVARQWAPGDSMRRIHWRASAHRDELMVRQEEQETAPEAVIVLDRGAMRWSPGALERTGADAAFETAVTLCASAVVRLVQDGYAVEVIDADGTPLCARIDATDAGALEDAMFALATVTARPDDRLLALIDVFSGTTTGPLVVITGHLGRRDAEALAVVAHHSSYPMLLSASPEPDALEAAGSWATARLRDDAAGAWRAAGVWRSGDAAA
ncbi:DUF58 domain-containing protein [Microbacterium caowuchunii]|uniref:DUF58 domain-containing protein n=1 Tax=Microbacterium caowuchunii TaxID=2614638 RepID=A0A5N0T8C9_9MICO|nr:DUF58 domain-containing protein [Microbacterium caowuchunii]KAA9131190.1 DUF58 domain-containing protein [Microbacterium caowuchunii]